MNKSATRDAYGTLIEPTTLKMQRLLPGPIERIWAWLVESDKRRKWLAAGEMELKVGAPFELVWRNDELTNPPGKRPDNCAEEHRKQSRITALDAPRRIAFGDVREMPIALVCGAVIVPVKSCASIDGSRRWISRQVQPRGRCRRAQVVGPRRLVAASRTLWLSH